MQYSAQAGVWKEGELSIFNNYTSQVTCFTKKVGETTWLHCCGRQYITNQSMKSLRRLKPLHINHRKDAFCHDRYFQILTDGSDVITAGKIT